MLSKEERPTIADSLISNLSEELSPYSDLTELMQDFPIAFQGLGRALHISEEEMVWQLRSLPLKGYACFFIILSSGELLRKTEIFTYSREYPRIFVGRTNPEEEVVERLALGHIKEKENPWGDTSYILERATGVPMITAEGNTYKPSLGSRFPQRFPCTAQTPRGPVFPMVISRSERVIREVTYENFDVYSFDPGLASKIWNHLRNKPGFLEGFR